MNEEQLSSGDMPIPAAPVRRTAPLRFFFILLITGWTAAIGLSFWYNSSRLEEHALDSARIQARTAFEKDVVYRRWNSQHNGVFVPVVPGKFEPNPYLPEKGREVIGQDGRILTKINPAYMTRLVHEIGALQSGVVGHITSNKPIRKGNEPDTWESQSLTMLEQHLTDEVTSLAVIDGREYMRLIRGLDTEESCLSCHAKQGYKVGEVRGGISVSVPMEPFRIAVQEQKRTLFITHLALWLVGLALITAGTMKLASGLRERDIAEAGLRELAAELEQRVAERTLALKIRQQELQAFVDNANAGVYLKQLDGTYRICNDLFASIIERPPDYIKGRTDDELLDPETAARIKEHDAFIMESGRAAELKNGFVSRQGVRYSCFTFPVKEEDHVVGLGGLLVDMSERDRTEQALREARDAAEKASRAKSDFLANMSHEIRTPLNGVIGMADLLLRTRLTPDQASMAAAIKTSGDSLLLVLNDVLDISKIEAGKFTLEQIPFQLRDVLFDSIKGLTPIAYKKNIELILHVSPSVPENLIGDPVRLRQIILNLVNNALKFTEQGEVVVAVLLVSGTEEKVRLRFSVTDTGIGIPLDKQENIFQAFEQVDSSTTRKYGGSGLGLAICSRILDLMGSKIELKSHEGFGSSFWFEVELPIEKDGETHKPLVCTEALKGMRALIVDDNDTNLRILHETLADWGMEVRQCSSVDEAFALAALSLHSNRPFNVILTDLQMPEKDGIDLLHLIRNDPSLKSMPMILLSSGNLPREVQGEVGKPDFFSSMLDKPVRPEVLMRAIASALNIWESYDVQELTREEEQKKLEKDGVSLRVLLAEDVEMNQMVASRMLRELGHTVTVVGDGKEALEAVLAEEYDMILMDIQMPVMDGIQATLAIREMERQGMLKKRMNIVAMTANALKGDKEKYLAVGMDAYLAKPILLDELRKVIAEVMHLEPVGGQEEKPKPSTLAPSWCAVQGAVQAEAKRVNGAPREAEAVSPEPAAEPPTAEPAAKPAAPGGEQPQSLIDWSMLHHSFAGDTGFMMDTMHLYMRDAPRLLREAREATDRQDNAALTVNAHALKGITGYFTRERAYALSLDLEEIGRDGGLPDRHEEVEAKFAELLRLVDSLISEMQEFIARNSA